MNSTLNADRTGLPGYFWRGLGLWNFYFIAKLMLYWAGFLNLHVFYNLVFLAALLAPLPPLWLHRLRHIAAIPVGIALLYYDSWLPPFSRLLAQPEVLHFSADYLLELLGRFINWNMLGAGLIALVTYTFLSQWVRMTVFVVVIMSLVGLSQITELPGISWDKKYQASLPTQMVSFAATTDGAVIQGPTPMADRPINTVLDDQLAAFYTDQHPRKTQFSVSPTGAEPFDILFLNICSLSWDDLEISNLLEHPLLKSMDVIFDDFNSATAYSGPAVLRLLRASCGQTSHQDLYREADDQCYLFENLKQLGFQTQTALNHDGQFQGFLDELTAQGRFPAPTIPSGSRPRLSGFDGSPIWGDLDTLSQWWSNRLQQGSPSTALLYNTITLHDGNREATADGGSRAASYSSRAQRLLDELDVFMAELERSGRRVAVIFVPEHGASLQGDRMQIAGMREIPTPKVTHIPVGLRLVGAKSGATARTTHLTAPSSYLALSELVARLISNDVFDADSINWQTLTQDLPQTAAVAENADTVLMSHGQTPYVRIGGRDWVEYQQ